MYSSTHYVTQRLCSTADHRQSDNPEQVIRKSRVDAYSATKVQCQDIAVP
jgi:hypothetical protein